MTACDCAGQRVLGANGEPTVASQNLMPHVLHAVIPMLHEAIGRQLFSNRSLILTRQKTQEAPVHHVANGGNAWDTVKPLQKHFGGRIHRVVLVDDDAYKVTDGRQSLQRAQRMLLRTVLCMIWHR